MEKYSRINVATYEVNKSKKRSCYDINYRRILNVLIHCKVYLSLSYYMGVYG